MWRSCWTGWGWARDVPSPANRPPHKPAAGQRSAQNPKGRWPDREVRFTALWTDHPPLRKVELATDPAQGVRSRLEFEPLGHAEQFGITMGLLHSGYLPKALAFSAIAVKRGRWGTKPAEMLMPLQLVSAEVLAWPGARLRGMLRSLPAAVSGVAAGPAQLASTAESAAGLLWVAAELNLHGWLDQGAISEMERMQGWQRLKPGPDVAKIDRAWVWRGYARELAAKLERELVLPRRANPFRTELSRTQAARLLRRQPDELTALALEELADKHKFKLVHRAYPETYKLGGKLLPAAPALAKSKLAEALLESFKAGGVNLRTVPVESQHLGVLNQLFEAERIVDLHQGFTVPIALLHRWLEILKPDMSEAPATRELKHRLSIGRREAEALRAWLVAQKGPQP
jgi:hypothetical protein